MRKKKLLLLVKAFYVFLISSFLLAELIKIVEKFDLNKSLRFFK